MCLKWSAHELWSENFEILIFIECRTLNYIGPMTCRFFSHSDQNYSKFIIMFHTLN